MSSVAPSFVVPPAFASRIAFGSTLAAEAALSERAKALPIGLWDIDRALPDGGIPRCSVVEIASPGGLARATSWALAACASAQSAARLRGGAATAGAWCAWIDATETPGASSVGHPSLFAPAVQNAGVDLSKLLVVCPPADALARVAVRVASSRVFSVVVVDIAGVPGAAARQRLDKWGTAVRRLSLAIEGTDTAVILLTDARARRTMPLPAAMRIELERPASNRLNLRIAKERHGRVAAPKPIFIPRSA
jgi:recombination protein RecA